MPPVRPDETQDAARAKVRALLRLRRPAKGAQKWLAEAANVGYGTINNWLGGRQNMGSESLSAIAKVLGVSVEHLFYNAPDEQVAAPAQAPEDWREQLREIERYIRSIEDPVERVATIRRLLAVTRERVEAYERRVDVARAAGRVDAGAAPAPGVRPGRPGRAVK